MFCATCFQTAEEGSKYCTDCRLKRQASPDPFVALPTAEAQPSPWTAPAVPGVAASPWQEETVWTPPLPTEPPAVAGPSSLESAEDYIANPFGEPAEGIVPAAPPLEASVDEPRVLEDAPAFGAPASAEPPLAAEAQPTPADLYIEPLRTRGSSEITTMLAVGVVLLSLASVGQVLRPSSTPSVSSPTASGAAIATMPMAEGGGEHGEAARKLLASAAAAFEANDFDGASRQIEQALQEMTLGGATAVDIARTKLGLAQARLAAGDFDGTLALCQELASTEIGSEAQKLAARASNQIMGTADMLLSDAVNDVKADRPEQGAAKAAQAVDLLERYGASPDKIAAARELATMAAQARQGGRGGEGSRRELPNQRRQQPRPSAERPEAEVQAPVEAPVARPRVASQPRTQESAYPTGQRPSARQSAEQPQAIPDDLPMMTRMRGQSPQRPEEAPQGPTSQPAEPQVQRFPQPPRTSSPPEEGSGRGRAGSEDVLPTYNSQTGGSAY